MKTDPDNAAALKKIAMNHAIIDFSNRSAACALIRFKRCVFFEQKKIRL
ncbi:hypothetical protein HC231_18105 [Brenneria izadpanahii]|uniref:Uncharacterized protein n=1 Tax=Brenneria izadpanahii TaxID=2722756 RepID=A0ABX7V175_9GAMM|nr:hypothetical protein [Brenneria izadpanahii]QTF09618.1 hypothetical protein HC231_18105 [Brenneria izadpanahii]